MLQSGVHSNYDCSLLTGHRTAVRSKYLGVVTTIGGCHGNHILVNLYSNSIQIRWWTKNNGRSRSGLYSSTQWIVLWTMCFWCLSTKPCAWGCVPSSQSAVRHPWTEPRGRAHAVYIKSSTWGHVPMYRTIENALCGEYISLNDFLPPIGASQNVEAWAQYQILLVGIRSSEISLVGILGSAVHRSMALHR